MIFYGVITKGLPTLQKMPSKLREHLLELKDSLFEVLPLLHAQPHCGIGKDQMIKFGGKQHQSAKPLCNRIFVPFLQKANNGW